MGSEAFVISKSVIRVLLQMLWELRVQAELHPGGHLGTSLRGAAPCFQTHLPFDQACTLTPRPSRQRPPGGAHSRAGHPCVLGAVGTKATLGAPRPSFPSDDGAALATGALIWEISRKTEHSENKRARRALSSSVSPGPL